MEDVDIAVLLRGGLDAERSVESQLQFEVDLERLTKCPVRVTILNHASPFLAYQLLRDGVLIFERDRSERIAFREVGSQNSDGSDLSFWLFCAIVTYSEVRQI